MKIARLIIVLNIFMTLLFADVRNFYGDVLTDTGMSFKYKGSLISGDKLAVKKNICYDENGKEIINEKTEYNETTCEVVNMHIQDFQTGKVEMIIDKGNSYLVKYKKNYTADFKEKEIPKKGIIIHPTVLAMYMQKNMDAILYGKGVNVTLLLPNRLCTLDFLISRTREKEIDNQKCHELILEPNSMLIKQFVNPIYFYVKKDDPSVLVKYEGVVAPTDPAGNAQKGHIMFSFN